MKELSFEELSKVQDGVGGWDCALAVGLTVGSTLLFGAAIAAGPASGGITTAAALSFLGSKIFSISGIVAACSD